MKTSYVAAHSSKEEESQLMEKARMGDVRALNTLLSLYAPLVRKTARSVAKKGATNYVSFEDLIQEGTLGLWEALGRYAEEYGASFETYAIRRIRGSMIDLLRKNSTGGRSLRVAIRVMEEARTQLEHTLLRRPTLTEWKHALPKNLQERFEEIRIFWFEGVTLSLMQADADGDEFETLLLVADEGRSVEDALIDREEENSKELLLLVEQALACLDERGKKIIFWRYQVPKEESRTLFELSEEFCVTESRICQLEARALATMRRYLRVCYRDEVKEVLRKVAR